MPIRQPAVAGLFYPSEPQRCRAEVEHYLSVGRSIAAQSRVEPESHVYGGIAPHAGWAYSGAVAAHSLRWAGAEPVDTVVIFGAVHRPHGRVAVVYTSGGWQTPLGEIAIDEELARAVVAASPLLIEDLAAHGPEHSIEVEVPFLQMTAPSARLLPIMVPPTESSHQVGHVVAQEARRLGRRVLFFGSSDLTHYGPRFDFTPEGSGSEGIRWSKEVNDCRMLDLVTSMQEQRIVPEAREHWNACGSGAIAATIAACAELGASCGTVLEHTNSSEVIGEQSREMNDAVGYASIIFK